MRIWCCGSWRNLCKQRCMSSGTLVESVREVEKRRPWWACLESRGWNLSSVLSTTSNNIKIKLENDIIKFLFRKVTLVMIGREPGWAVKQANVMGTYAKAALYLLGVLPLVSTPPPCQQCHVVDVNIPPSPTIRAPRWTRWEQRKHSSFMWEGEVKFNLTDQEAYMD